MVAALEGGIERGVVIVDAAVPRLDIVTDKDPAVLLRKVQKAPADAVVMPEINVIVLKALLVML